MDLSLKSMADENLMSGPFQHTVNKRFGSPNAKQVLFTKFYL